MASPQHHQKAPGKVAARESFPELRLCFCVVDVSDERRQEPSTGLQQLADRLDLLDRMLELAEVVVAIDAHADETTGRSDRPSTHPLLFLPHESPQRSSTKQAWAAAHGRHTRAVRIRLDLLLGSDCLASSLSPTPRIRVPHRTKGYPPGLPCCRIGNHASALGLLWHRNLHVLGRSRTAPLPRHLCAA